MFYISDEVVILLGRNAILSIIVIFPVKFAVRMET